MDFDAMAYPDIFTIGGTDYKGRRDRKKSEVHIPYTDAPAVEIGDVVLQANGPSTIQLKVLDVDYVAGGSLNVGTNHPHMLNLHVENLTSAAHRPQPSPSTIQIGSLHGHQVQVGNHNTQVTNISLADVVKEVAERNDEEAKGIVRKLLENNTVAALVGAAVPGLLSLLS